MAQTRSKKKIRKDKSSRRIRKTRGGGSLSVLYGTTRVLGQELPRSVTQKEPTVNIPQGHTLILFDPDAPSGTYLHWLKTSEGTLWPYRPPTPPSGVHRYIFRLVEGVPAFIPKKPAPIDPSAILPGRVRGEVYFLSR